MASGNAIGGGDLGQDKSGGQDQKNCPVCDQPGTVPCPSCKDVLYCSEGHKQEDRTSGYHKDSCQKWQEVKVKSKYGGSSIQFKAKRDFDPELGPEAKLFERRIILVIPRTLTDMEKKMIALKLKLKYSDELMTKSIVPCLGCYQACPYWLGNLDEDQSQSRGWPENECTGCKWPVHNEICRQEHEAECHILERVNFTSYSLHPEVFLLIGVLRAVLLKKTNRQDFDKLFRMPHKAGIPPIIFNEDQKFTEADNLFQNNLEIAKRFITRDCKLDCSEEEVVKLYRILWSNSFLCNDTTHVRSNPRFCHLIFDGSQGRVLPHSCKPNLDVCVRPGLISATFKVIAPIKAGDCLTIDYDSLAAGQCQYKGVISRQMFIQINCWADPCRCPRCACPSEDKTYFSALKCPGPKDTKEECIGYLLPKDPNSIKQGSKWRCNNGSDKYNSELQTFTRLCETEKTLLDVESDIVIPVRQAINKRLDKPPYDLSKMRKTISGLSGSSLHPHHHVILAGLIQVIMPASLKILDPSKYYNPKTKEIKPKFKFHKEYKEDLGQILRSIERILPGRIGFLRACFELTYVVLQLSKLCEEITTLKRKDEVVDFLTNKSSELQKFETDVNVNLGIMKGDPMLKRDYFFVTKCELVFRLHVQLFQNAAMSKGLTRTDLPGKYGNVDWKNYIAEKHAQCFPE